MLREQASSLTHLVDILPAGVLVIDGNGAVKSANQIAVDLLGQPLEGMSWRDVITRAFEPQADDGHEVSLKDGRKVQIKTTDLSPQPGQLVLVTDLSETRRLQQRLANSKNLSMLGNMMATLAHQIRTPLSAAMLYAANLGNPSLPVTAQGNFQKKLMSRLQDLEGQINDMLLYAKSGTKQVAETVSLQNLLSEVQLGSEVMIKQAQGALTTTLPEPDVLIYGNKNALASAIQNLIHNSVEIIGCGAEIALSAVRDPNNDQQVCIQVTDNGPGIDKATQSQIFEPFFTTRSKGTGLGLAVVKAVAEQHAGSVSVTSELEQGATFRIHLPIAEVAQQAMPLCVGAN